MLARDDLPQVYAARQQLYSDAASAVVDASGDPDLVAEAAFRVIRQSR